ncbi:hypothetical protein SSKA14_3868 [Stenotrophomonas sp. SKA14]|nr:hypothetical protein SSKA14_3868 [Stenotrophomonas sp. SKA14]
MWRFRGRTMTADRASQAARSGPSGPRPVVTLVEHWALRLDPNPRRTALAGPTRT